MAGKKNRVLYQLKVTLRDIHPPLWRRIQVWKDATLGQLHQLLQIVVGWEDCHLHEFVIGRRVYSVPDPEDDLCERKGIDESRERLREVVPRVGTPFEYLYDFGDSAIAGGMTCCWRPSYCQIRERSFRAASPGNAARHPRMWVDRPAMPITWKRWPTPGMKSTRICCNGAAHSIRSRFRLPPSTTSCRRSSARFERQRRCAFRRQKIPRRIGRRRRAPFDDLRDTTAGSEADST